MVVAGLQAVVKAFAYGPGRSCSTGSVGDLCSADGAGYRDGRSHASRTAEVRITRSIFASDKATYVQNR
jgi:hypothetical protein